MNLASAWEHIRFFRNRFAMSNSRFLFYMLLGIFAVTIVPFIVLSFYNHPSADDFCYTNQVSRLGFWGTQSDLYMHWSGRYVSNFLLSGISYISIHWMNLATIVQISPLLIFAMLIGSLFYFIHALAGKSLGLTEKSVLVLAIFVSYIANCPSPPEGIYWLTGTVTYQVGGCLLLLFLGSIAKYVRAMSRRERLWLALLLLVLTVVAAGVNEILMSVLAMIFVCASVYVFRSSGAKHRSFFVCLAIAAAVSFFIAITAPGNWVRANSFQHYGLLRTVFMAFYSAAIAMAKWLNAPLLFSSIFVLPVGMCIIRGMNIRKHYHPILIFSLVFLVISICFVPSLWATGTNPPLRAQNFIYLLFVISWFVFVVLFVDYGAHTYNLDAGHIVQFRSMKSVSLMLSIVFLFALCGSRNVQTAWKDWVNGSARAYNQELMERSFVIQESKARGVEDVRVPQLTYIPYTIFFSDIQNNAADWQNVCYAEYAKIHSIYTE